MIMSVNAFKSIEFGSGYELPIGNIISLRIGIISAGISTIAGLILGLISGYFGGAASFVFATEGCLLLQ